ncbi:glucose-6-phosphate dehydrogenase [Paenibacillus beijingensis]|uniref:Glucose-6-phosphate 1-dehydrogenase n=1 Tax=Paenibacillus beijingensis TaxID=1126833 RepID=A0A0D5NFI1_9BACL|nr:glucose-6-phosphate dehydrogenase [Paenibacillus beijingensis]AJY74026.1 glucose-6-phosphate dehydrogenase [Paenibacillus beijingensis]
MDSMTFVLFGATGDLAKRKIYPALYNLFLDRKLPQSFSVIGLGRRALGDEVFQGNVEQSLREFSRRSVFDPSDLSAFISAFRYVPLDVTNPDDYRKLLQVVEKREQELNIPQNRMFYLSVAPEFFDTISLNINESGLGTGSGWKRLIIEKPFGHDLQSAQELNEKLSKAFQEEEIYRIDHYLGKPMVQNLEALVFANPVIGALWNNRHIANVQITASETVGVEERAGYYDQSGAIRDMFQNHMLQVLMMAAMNRPSRLNATEIREQKRSVLASLRDLPKSEVAGSIVRGQYGAGVVGGKEVPAYRDEPGIGASSLNDTFVAARLWIDEPQWEGVPFYIRTGKRIGAKSTRVVVEFKNTARDLYMTRNESTTPNLLVIEIGPNERVSFFLNGKDALNDGQIGTLNVDYSANLSNVPEAYERLIHDALRGDSTFFAHWNEVELAWKWVQPVLEAFQENQVPLQFYPAGSNGPEAADKLLAENGFKWWLDENKTALPEPLSV